MQPWISYHWCIELRCQPLMIMKSTGTLTKKTTWNECKEHQLDGYRTYLEYRIDTLITQLLLDFETLCNSLVRCILNPHTWSFWNNNFRQAKKIQRHQKNGYQIANSEIQNFRQSVKYKVSKRMIQRFSLRINMWNIGFCWHILFQRAIPTSIRTMQNHITHWLESNMLTEKRLEPHTIARSIETNVAI